MSQGGICASYAPASIPAKSAESSSVQIHAPKLTRLNQALFAGTIPTTIRRDTDSLLKRRFLTSSIFRRLTGGIYRVNAERTF